MSDIFEGIGDKPECQHRALQLCKVQDDVVTVYVCRRCSSKFQVEPLAKLSAAEEQLATLNGEHNHSSKPLPLQLEETRQALKAAEERVGVLEKELRERK